MGAQICWRQGRHETVTSNRIYRGIRKSASKLINLRDSRIQIDPLTSKFV